MTTLTELRKAHPGTRVTVKARPWIKFTRQDDGTWAEVQRMGSKTITLKTGELFEVGVEIDKENA